jgi:hypothetical protein
MRTTITVAPDVAAEMERLRREEGLGASEALNTLARRGMARASRPHRYVHRAHDLGLRVDVADVAAALELIDEDERAHR